MASWTGDANKRRTSPQGHRCSTTLAWEEEEDKAESEADSPKHKRWRRGCVTAMEGSHHTGARVRERAQE
jgi:hypothetical protein